MRELMTVFDGVRRVQRFVVLSAENLRTKFYGSDFIIQFARAHSSCSL